MATVREKKHTIREAGRRVERAFFGKRGIFVKAGHVGHLTKRKNPTGGPFDQTAARELELYATNHADLYRQMETPIRLNLEKKFKKGTYQSPLAVKLWLYWADEAAKRYNKEFGGGGSKWFEIFSPATRLHVAKEQESFHHGEMELGNFQVKNPGRPHGKFRSCVRQVSRHRLPVGSDPKAICGAALTKQRRRDIAASLGYPAPSTHAIETRKRNPITLVGNPPKRITANVAGVLYNRCLEIRAEKTLGRHKGLWYHPFKRDSDVQILALDTGDLLIHSRSGKFLWRPDA
jgi:hypothetical protein